MAKKTKKPPAKKKAPARSKKKAPAGKAPARPKEEAPARSKKKKEKASPKAPSSAKALAELEALLGVQVKAGYDDRETVLGLYEDEPEEWPGVTQAEAEALVDRLFAAQRAAQATWRGTTDNDRLEAVFADLERERILCRDNYWCCMTCGLSAIAEELKEAEARGARADGYVFFHAQDTERAAEGGGLMLAFGAESGDEDDGVKVGQRVVKTLRKHGLVTDWNGTFAQRIPVTMEWRKRID
jgi:hypothetical protein